MKLWQKIFTASAIGCTIFINLPTVDAKIVTDRVPLLTYADSSVPVYDAPNGTDCGKIRKHSYVRCVLIARIQDYERDICRQKSRKKRDECRCFL